MSTTDLILRTREYLMENNMYQSEFARLAKISAGSLCNFLAGRRQSENILNAIEKVLNRGEKKKEAPANENKSVWYPREKEIIRTPEEIIEELKSGNTIFLQDTLISLTMQDGYIVRYNEGTPIAINTPILLDEVYYVYREIKPQLQVGRMYLSVSNRKCFICAQDDRGYVGVFLGDKDSVVFTVDGRTEDEDKCLYKEVSND